MKSMPIRTGFTLIEMLVVIAIIAVLIAMILPALCQAREMAKQTVCLSNLRQMHIAAEIYVNNYGGYYPIAYYNEFSPSLSIFYTWDLTSIKDWSTNPPTIRIEPGILWQGIGNIRIQQCPSFKGAANWLEDPYTGYNYNTSYIGHGSGESITTPARIVDVRSPTTCALFGDGEWESGANKFMRAPWPNPGDAGFFGRTAGTQGYRHRGYTNVVYCDGHAKSVRECYTDTDSSEQPVANGTGFLSPDNSAYSLDGSSGLP